MTPKMIRKIAAITFTPALIAGCAGVNFYSDKALTTKTGLPIYSAKPYLLVARTEDKEKPTQVSIVYLPDSERVVYADPRSGFGSAKLKLVLANGQLTEFGQDTDTKIAELITSLGGLRTALAGADKTSAEADQIRSTLHGAKPTLEMGKIVTEVAKDMKSKMPPGTELSGLTPEQMADIKAAQKALEIAGQTLENPAAAPLAPGQLAVVKVQVNILERLPAKGKDPKKEEAALKIVQGWIAKLKESYQEAETAAPAKQIFELYEIIQGANGSYLRPVTPSTPMAPAGAP